MFHSSNQDSYDISTVSVAWNLIQLKFESIAQDSVSKDSYKCPRSPVTVQSQIVGVFLDASAALLLWAASAAMACSGHSLQLPCWTPPTIATGSGGGALAAGDVFWPELGISLSRGIPGSLRAVAELVLLSDNF